MIKCYTLNKVNYNDLHMIVVNMLNMYNSGITFIDTFHLIEELPLRKIYKESIVNIREKLEVGESLYISFSKYSDIYPVFFLSMIKIGEETGRLGDVLSGLEIYYNKMNFIIGKIKNFLAYPMILLISMMLLLLFLIIVVVPSFKDVFTSMGRELPKILSIILIVRDYVQHNQVVATIMFILWFIIIPGVIIWFNKENIKKLYVKLPIFKKFREYISVVLLSIVIKSGVSLSKGLQFCSTVDLIGNLKSVFNTINREIIEGKTLSDAMEKTQIYTKYTLAHIKLGEECGNLEDVLKNLEEELFSKLIIDSDRVLEMVSPMAILFIGVIILSFIMVFIMPVFDGLLR